jgi:DNA-binding CsgD family transcriptional regulator
MTLSDPARAEDLHHEALAVRASHDLWLFCADSLEALASLAARSGSYTEAVRLLAACDRARKDLGYPAMAGLAPDPATRPRLRTALGNEAYDTARAQGLASSLRDAVEYARRTRGRRGRPSSGWASLTPAEHSVVRLAAEGLSNPAIGARLFMSRSTVKTHLSHVYAKLGITNRTELATVAHPHLTGR